MAVDERLIGEEIKAFRLRLGLTQAELAGRYPPLTANHITNWERGDFRVKNLRAQIAVRFQELLAHSRGGDSAAPPDADEVLVRIDKRLAQIDQLIVAVADLTKAIREMERLRRRPGAKAAR